MLGSHDSSQAFPALCSSEEKKTSILVSPNRRKHSSEMPYQETSIWSYCSERENEMFLEPILFSD